VAPLPWAWGPTRHGAVAVLTLPAASADFAGR
jgi:hypothetical protein